MFAEDEIEGLGGLMTKFKINVEYITKQTGVLTFKIEAQSNKAFFISTIKSQNKHIKSLAGVGGAVSGLLNLASLSQYKKMTTSKKFAYKKNLPAKNSSNSILNPKRYYLTSQDKNVFYTPI